MNIKVKKQMQGYVHAFGTSTKIKNGLGLTILQLENKLVYAKYENNQVHAGYPGVMHGGIATTLLDELCGWAVIDALNGYYCVTAQFNTSYLMPIDLSKPSHVVAKVLKRVGKKLEVHAYLYNDDLQIMAKGVALFIEKSFVGMFADENHIILEPLLKTIPEIVSVPDLILEAQSILI